MWPDEKLPALGRSIQTALKKLQLLGVYHPQTGVIYKPQEKPKHPLVINSTPNECFATIPDGLGNQGLLLSRKNPDNSFSLIGVAIHDQQGIVDSFGFQDLNATDVQRFIERFYESGLKTPVTPEYFAYKVTAAEQKTLSLYQRLPYEYRAWSVLISDITPHSPSYEKLIPRLD